MAIDQTGADVYFKTQLTNDRWKANTKQDKSIVMAITEIATALGYNDDTDLDEDDENVQKACYEQALFLSENLSDLDIMHKVEQGNLASQIVTGLGEESYKSNGKLQSLNGIILASRASIYLKRVRGPFRMVR